MAGMLAGVAPAAQAPAPKQFSIIDAALHQYDGGPALRDSHQFLPGELVFVSFRLAGYQKTGEERERVHMTWRVEAFDAAGVRLVESKSETIDTELAAQDKNWMPKARHDFALPPMLASGAFRVVISATDELGKKSVRQEIGFRVQGREVAPSEKMVARNFRFLRSEQDGPALASAAYRQGDSVWARFEITGYKLGERNRYELSYGLEVVRDADGRSLYVEAEAARLSEESFYPKRYQEGALSLRLQPDTTKGSYTILLRLRDALGGQTDESRHRFVVE